MVQRPQKQQPIAQIWLFTGVNKLLSYRVPRHLTIKLGSLVRVPLGQRSLLGVVVQLLATESLPAIASVRLKTITEVLYPWPVLTPDLLKLGQWLVDYYAASRDAVIDALLPVMLRRGLKPKIQRLIQAQTTLSSEALARLSKRAPKQAQLYTFLKQQTQPLPKALVLKQLQLSAATCKALVDKEIIIELTEVLQRSAYQDDVAVIEHTAAAPRVALNKEQTLAVEDIGRSIDKGVFQVHLLHGVTGSGKTEVYLAAMRHTLEQGRSVLFLVPEVALTPQTVGRLRARLADLDEPIVVWHSHLSAGERFDGWQALATGKARVVVGARSAVFAPLQDLRLIIVDEEHEPAYKQDEVPRYHGRDVAVYRARLCRATCILGSATPSLESLYNTRNKGYKLNELKYRVDNRQLPTFYVVDLKREYLAKKMPGPISRLLTEKLRLRFEVREQAILFINRRGYASHSVCSSCGYVPHCDHCSVTLTYHKADCRLRCHICNAEHPVFQYCPQCNEPQINWQGFGTQRIVESLQQLLPKTAKIVRLDADTMRRKNTFRETLADFRLGKIDVLVGTQMIAKGLDFPNVTLVGVIDADLSLHVPDFRAHERTFQLLVQVAGRAGRGDRAGEVVVQTFTPVAAPIQYARRSDFAGFLDEELALRREFHYPPYRRLARHIFRGENANKVAFFAEQWVQYLEAHLLEKIEIRGPAPAPLEKVKGYYRFHLWYFLDNVSRQVAQIQNLRQHFIFDKDIIDVLDIDPVDML